MEPDCNFCVGKRPVGKCSVDVDESHEKRDRQMESAYGQYDTGDQERCRGGDGSMVEKIPSRWARGAQVKKSVAVEHGGETHPPMGRSCGEVPTNHWLAEVVRARAVQCWRWAQHRHTDKWTGVHPKRFNIFQWEDQLCKWHSEGCTKNPWSSHQRLRIWTLMQQNSLLWNVRSCNSSRHWRSNVVLSCSPRNRKQLRTFRPRLRRSAAGSVFNPLRLCAISWNVAGIPLDDLDLWL